MPIQFNDDLEVNEITKHSRAVLDDLFWEDDEIAEFRHYAFLVACGLENDEEDEEDEMVSLEGFELSEEEKSVVTQMHSSLPVIDIDFDILESKQKCLKQLEQVQEKPKPKPKQPKIKNRLCNLAPRIAKFQDLMDRQMSEGQMESATNIPFSTTGKRIVQRSLFKKAPRDETIEERLEKEEEEDIEDSRRNICIQDRLRLWKERDEVCRQSHDSSDRYPIDIPPPPPSTFLDTSSPRLRRPRISEKKLRKSTRTPRPAPLDMDNSDQSPIDLSSSPSRTPPDASPHSKLDDSQRAGLDVSQGHQIDTSQGSQQNTSHEGLKADKMEPVPNETQRVRGSRSKSPKPKNEGVGKTKSHDTPRSGKKKLTSETPTDVATSGEIKAAQFSAICIDPLSSPDDTPRSRKSKTTKVKTKEKSLSISSLDTTSTQSTDKVPKSPRKKSPKPSGGSSDIKVKTKEKSLSISSLDTASTHSTDKVPKSPRKKSPKPSGGSSDILVSPRASRKSSNSKPHSFSSLDADSLHSSQEVAQDHSTDVVPKSPRKKSPKPSGGPSDILGSHRESRKSSSNKPRSFSSLDADSLHSSQDVAQDQTIDTVPTSPRKKSQRPSGSSDVLVSPKASRKSSNIKPPSLSSLDVDSIHSSHDVAQDPAKKHKTRSSKSVKMSEKEQSLSSMDTGSSHSNNGPPKSPKRPSSTSKMTVELTSPKKSSTTKKEEERDIDGDDRASKKKSSTLKRSTIQEINNVSPSHSDGVEIDKRSPSAAKKKPASIIDTCESDGENSPKSRSLHRSTTEPTKRHSLPVPIVPTLTVTIRKGKKKEASNVRRRLVRRSLSSCLVHVNPQEIEWKETVKRSNSMKMTKVMS